MDDPERDHALSRTQNPSSGLGLDATVSSEAGRFDHTGTRGASRLELVPGTRVGDRLALERKLGMGGMGEVWAARHTVLDKSVAVKFLLDHIPGTDDAAQRFLREARAAAGLDHPGIVNVQDFGNTADGTPYLVMELLTGRPLSDHLASGGRLDWRTARQWLLQIVAALGFAHRNGVIHRDLKPSNIFLVDHDDGVTCKLIDFGLAKITRGDAPVDPLTTRTGAILGTPTYMSPEQLKAQEADHRADIYALGCVAYEMLTGNHAFRAASATELAAKHLYETPPVDPLHAIGTPPAFVALILRCLQKDPTARFQSTSELRGALEALPGGAQGPGVTPMPAVLDPTVRSGDQLRVANLSHPPGGAARRPVVIAVGAGLLGVAIGWVVLASRATEQDPVAPTTPAVAVPTPTPTPPPAPTEPAIPPTPPPVDTPIVPTPATPILAPTDPATSTIDPTPSKRPRPGKRVVVPPPPEPTAPPPVEPPPPVATPTPPPVPESSGDFEKRNRLKDPFETKKGP